MIVLLNDGALLHLAEAADKCTALMVPNPRCDLQLKQLGHSVDKVEFIVMGGTFMALPEDYRDYFIRNLHDALSGHTSNSVAEAVRYLMNSV